MESIISVNNLKKYFIKKKLLKNKEIIKAVDDVSFFIKKGETFVLAGESGSGKTTIARLILRDLVPDSGTIIFESQEVTDQKEQIKKIRSSCQMVHQDPYSSLNPRMSVLDIVKEPLEIHSIGNKIERNKLALDALEQVNIEKELATNYPHMLSGGQRQRVAIARAIVTKPKIIIADEPVSMLDVSVRVGILKLLKVLQEKLEISILYITHDLATANYIGHRIAILYLGKIVEMGPINEILSNPGHPYTQALIDSIPDPDPNNLKKERKIRIKNSTDLNITEGCRFRARCPYAIEKCKEDPQLEKISNERQVACFVKIN